MKFPSALSDAENNALLIEAKNGSEEAKARFFEVNMRLMVFKANQFKNTGFEYEDLFSACQFGFLKAYNSFDLSKEVRFATYVTRCMENEMFTFMQKNKRHRKHSYLEFVVRKEEGNEPITLADVTPSPTPSIAMEDVDALRQALTVFKKKATPRNRLIISLRFEKEWDQDRIAAKFGISQSYVSRLIKQAVNQISQNSQIKECQAQ